MLLGILNKIYIWYSLLNVLCLILESFQSHRQPSHSIDGLGTLQPDDCVSLWEQYFL